MTYAIVGSFNTIQGEGSLAGTPATFVRFGGCNMWSGIERTREADAERNGARCPMWCDTDFRTRAHLSLAELVDLIKAAGDRPLIVLTGGEPLLQVDRPLIDALTGPEFRSKVQIETNGTVEASFGYNPRLHITLSPKVERSRIKLTACDELKLVYPAHDPALWVTFPARARWIQPQADREQRDLEHEAQAAEYVQGNPDWRLSLQTHKILGIR